MYSISKHAQSSILLFSTLFLYFFPLHSLLLLQLASALIFFVVIVLILDLQNPRSPFLQCKTNIHRTINILPIWKHYFPKKKKLKMFVNVLCVSFPFLEYSDLNEYQERWQFYEKKRFQTTHVFIGNVFFWTIHISLSIYFRTLSTKMKINQNSSSGAQYALLTSFSFAKPFQT